MSLGRLCLIVTLAFGILSAPLAARAQPAGKIYRIGMLETTSPALNAANLGAFRQGLRDLGYVEGLNLIIENRSADGRVERFPALAAELVRLQVDLIVTRGTPAVRAAKNATSTIHVVMASIGEPVGTGVVGGLARPGGNVTGLTAMVPELAAKRVELIREMVPRLARIAVLFDASNPVVPPQWENIEAAARSLGVQAQLFDARRAEDIARALDAALRQRADVLLVGMQPVMLANRRTIVELAAKHRLPAVYGSREFIDVGGLMSYGPNPPDLYRRAASFVDKILKGTKPGDLPVEQPTTFELVINLKSAKALGLAVPQSLLLRADHVIR